VRPPFADRSVIITGASDGIGAALARKLASQGAWLALGARRAHELDLVAQDCIAAGGRAIVIPTDVTDPAQCENLVAHAVASYGRVDVLVNNAGIGAHFRFADVTDVSVFERVMRVNYLGSVYATRAALSALRTSRGLIVAISSLAGRTGTPYRTAYAASKHAMQGFFDSLRIELDGTGVGVTVISPGFVRTSIRAHALDADGTERNESPIDEALAMPLDECVARIVEAMASRRRDVLMSVAARVGVVVKAIAPRVIDAAARRVMDGSVPRRPSPEGDQDAGVHHRSTPDGG
jgi:short-subunit dehydrogenase